MSLDPTTKDAIRQIPVLKKAIEAQALEIKKIQESQAYMKEILREIKKSVTRKYTKSGIVEKITGKKNES